MIITLILLCVVLIIGCVESTVRESEPIPVFELKLIDTEGETYTIHDVYDFNISQTENGALGITGHTVDVYYYVGPEYASPEYDIDLYKAHIQYQGITEYGVGDTYYIKAYYT